MPASLLSSSADMNSQQSLVEDSSQRALQTVALELSTMELSKTFGSKLGLHDTSAADNHSMGPSNHAYVDACGSDSDQPLKKTANMTAECVDVPTSEHVAEIVGRQGCKIKALRAKTNTYIRTPVRGEAPVFVVTGRKEDVIAAKREILSAADHFSQIRASRRNNSSGGTGGLHGPPSPSTPGQVTIQVRVPYRVVGLVVGPKGATIKRIQQQTQTYIVTPSRDKEPIFEVTGLPDNVEKARHEIESHIALRTGGGMADGGAGGNMQAGGMSNVNNGMGGNMPSRQHHNHMGGGGGGHVGNMGTGEEHVTVNDFQTNGVDAGSLELSGVDLMSSMYKPPSSNSAFTSYTNALNNRSNTNHQQQQQMQPPPHAPQDSNNIFAFPTSAGASLNGGGGGGGGKLSEHLTGAALSNGFSNNTFGLYDSDEGIGSSPSFDGNPMVAGLSGTSIWSDFVDLQVPPVGHSSSNPNGGNGAGVSSLMQHQLAGGSASSSGAGVPPAPRSESLSNAPCLSPTECGSMDGGLDHCSVRRLGSSDALTNTTIGLNAAMSAFTPLQQQQAPHAVNKMAATQQHPNGGTLGLSSSTSTSPTDSTGSLGGGNQRHGCFVALDNEVSPW